MMAALSRLEALLVLVSRALGPSPQTGKILRELDSLSRSVELVARLQAEGREQTGAFVEALERLEKQTQRGGKEQFRANAQAEALQRKIDALLEQVRQAEAYRERELETLRKKVESAQADSRLELIRALLPVLDGLEESLASAERIPKPQAAPSRWSWWRTGKNRLGTGPAEGWTAWLAGLRLVHERLLELLQAEGVSPIQAVGAVFDPQLHRAVERVAASGEIQPGSIVRELRRGYTAGDSVLRYAEVAVAF